MHETPVMHKVWEEPAFGSYFSELNVDLSFIKQYHITFSAYFYLYVLINKRDNGLHASVLQHVSRGFTAKYSVKSFMIKGKRKNEQ